MCAQSALILYDTHKVVVNTIRLRCGHTMRGIAGNTPGGRGGWYFTTFSEGEGGPECDEQMDLIRSKVLEK